MGDIQKCGIGLDGRGTAGGSVRWQWWPTSVRGGGKKRLSEYDDSNGGNEDSRQLATVITIHHDVMDDDIAADIFDPLYLTIFDIIT